jgi:hypothetical protein
MYLLLRSMSIFGGHSVGDMAYKRLSHQSQHCDEPDIPKGKISLYGKRPFVIAQPMH